MGHRRTTSSGPHPTRRSRLRPGGRSKAFERYLRGWPVVGVLLITLWSSSWTFNLVEYGLIRTTFGPAAWAGGLRVRDNKGHLTNGGSLSPVQGVTLYIGSYLLSVPFFLGSAIGFAYINMRLHGERFRDYGRRGPAAP